MRLNPRDLITRAWWLGFLGLFIPLALPPLILAVFSPPPKAVAPAVWLWADLFGSWSSAFSPAAWAAVYTALAAAFGFGVALIDARLRRKKA